MFGSSFPTIGGKPVPAPELSRRHRGGSDPRYCGFTMSAADLTPLEKREEVLAKTEILFREVNESIQELAGELGGDDFEFVCECSRVACTDLVKLSRREYERVRAEGTRFFVVPGHEDASVELIVARTDTYLIVEKDGHAGTVAEAADPRDGDL
jgi:hypothetical protein